MARRQPLTKVDCPNEQTYPEVLVQLCRLWVALGVACVLAFVGARAAEGDYTQVAEYFRAYVAPTQGGASGYSGSCEHYIVNEADWPGASYARVTYIDTSGNWHYTVKSTSSPLDDVLTVSQSAALGRTKEYCQNASNATVYLLSCSFKIYIFSNCA
jgi:hypothetical protein